MTASATRLFAAPVLLLTVHGIEMLRE